MVSNGTEYFEETVISHMILWNITPANPVLFHFLRPLSIHIVNGETSKNI